MWVAKDKRVTIAQSLYNTLCKEDQTEWSKEEILDYIKASGPFASFKLNRISSLIADPFNQIRSIDQSGFEVKPTGQSTTNAQVTDPNTQVTDRNTLEAQNTDQNSTIIELTDVQTV